MDGAVQIGGGAASYVVGRIDEDAGNAMKKGIQDFVSYDASGTMYDAFVDVTGIDKDIAYGLAHSAGNFAGQVVGYAAISMIPGGAAVTTIAGGLAAGGAAAEAAYANGASFDEAMITSSSAAVIGGIAGGASNQLGTLAKGATTLKGVVGYTAAGAVLGTAEPILNSGVEYLTYGNNDGSSYFEYMENSGGWLNVAMGAGSGGLSTGFQSLVGYNKNKYPQQFTAEMDAKTPEQSSTMPLKTAGETLIDKDILMETGAVLLDKGQKLDIKDLSYKKVGPVSTGYYMFESSVHRYSYVDTNVIEGLNDSIKQNGLYHFTDEVLCDKILDSGFVKESNMWDSYGNKKSFFFNGVPEVGAYATNIDVLPVRTTAVKIMPDSDLLDSSSIRVRHLDDMAITHDGNLNFSSGQASKEYFCLFKEDNKLVYKPVSKDFYDNYPNTESGKLLEDFVGKKSNVKAIKNDYYYNLSLKSTNAKIFSKN